MKQKILKEYTTKHAAGSMTLKEQAFVNSILQKQTAAAEKTRLIKFWVTFLLFWSFVGVVCHWRIVLKGATTYCSPKASAPAFPRDTFNPLVAVLPYCVECPPNTVCDTARTIKCREPSQSNNASTVFLLRPNNLVTWMHLVGVPLSISNRLLPFPLNQRVCLPDRQRVSNLQRLEHYLKASLQNWRSNAECPLRFWTKDRAAVGVATRSSFRLPLTVAARRAASNFHISKDELPQFQELWTAMVQQLPVYYTLNAATVQHADSAKNNSMWLVSIDGETSLCSNIPSRGSIVCPLLRFCSENMLSTTATAVIAVVAYYYFYKLHRSSIKRRRRRLVMDYMVRLVKNTLIEIKQNYLRAKARGYQVSSAEKYAVIAHLLDLYLLPDNHALPHSTNSGSGVHFRSSQKPWYSPSSWFRFSFGAKRQQSSASRIRIPGNRLLSQFDPRIRSYIHDFDKDELRALYKQIQSQISKDSNVRTSCFEIDGIQQDAWEWVGYLPPLSSYASSVGSAPSSNSSTPVHSPLSNYQK